MTARTKDMLNYVYDGQPDHMGYELVDEWKKELRDLGYIKFVKEENEWRTYITKKRIFNFNLQASFFHYYSRLCPRTLVYQGLSAFLR